MQVSDDNPPPPKDPPLGTAADRESFPWQEASDFANIQARQFLRSRRSHMAEEVAQEALVRLSRNLARIKGDWRPYLCQIVQNRARTHLRRELTRQKALPVARDEGSDPLDGHPGPALQAFLNECHAELPALLDELDDRFRRGTRAIVDFRSRRIPWAEIAELVSLSERTCSSRFNEAMTWLAERLSLEVARRSQND
jgi:RNA polymerase sigma factor (sigma-70 family)